MTRLIMPVLVSALLMSAARAYAQDATVTPKDVMVYGMKIHYLEAGRGAPVILLHGSGGEGARWMPTIRGLASTHRVLALDQIGFGASDKPPANFHTGVFSGFLQGFMKAIGIPKATLIGQSMGAGVALYFSIHHPEMVDRLVLVNGGGFRSADAAPRSPSPIDWHARQIANAGTLEESREYLEKLYYDDAFVTDELVESNLILRLRSAYTVESASRAGERGLGVTTEEEVRALRVPTLLLWGKEDVLSGPANADRLNAAISGSRKMFIEKAGHYPFIEQPAQFNKAVLEFLAAAASTE